MIKSWITTGLINFFTAAVMGCALRLMTVIPLDLNYGYLLHGHSHTAMLGWVYLMLYTFIFYYFIDSAHVHVPIYNRLFWLTQFAVVGVIVSFPIQGYAPLSIAFSTLHILCSYCFCYRIWKDCKDLSRAERKTLFAALFFLLLSTLALWSLGPATAATSKNSALVQTAIQFFTHFQFNGWFQFAVLAIFLRQLKGRINPVDFNWFYYPSLLASFLSFAQTLHWYFPHPILPWIQLAGLAASWIGYVFLIKLTRRSVTNKSRRNSKICQFLFGFALIGFALKNTLQTLSLLPELALESHSIRSFAIGYIHLLSLGIISSFLLAFTASTAYFKRQSLGLQWGVALFGFSFIASEILLFVQGYFYYKALGALPYYALWLFLVSLGLPLALLLITGSLRPQKIIAK